MYVLAKINKYKSASYRLSCNTAFDLALFDE